MSERVEKNYYLKKIEFLLLLSMAGARQIYSFEMEQQQDIANEKLIAAFHSLVKAKWLKWEDEKFVLSDEMQYLMEQICRSRYALSFHSGEETAFQKICYLSEVVITTELMAEEHVMRLKVEKPECFFDNLYELDALGTLETNRQGVLLQQHNQILKAERIKLENLFLPLDAPLTEWLNREDVLTAVELLSLTEQCVRRRFMVVRGQINSWLLMQDGMECSVLYDSKEERQQWIKFLKSCLLEEGGSHDSG